MHPNELDLVEWWLDATSFDGMSGQPGLPEWPFRGGILRQPAKLVEAVRLLRNEWGYVMASVRKPKSPEAQERPETERKGSG